MKMRLLQSIFAFMVKESFFTDSEEPDSTEFMFIDRRP